MTQTINNKQPWYASAVAFLWERARIWIASGLFWAITSIILYVATPFWQNLRAIWQAPATLGAVQVEMIELRADLTAVTGDNRVIRQTPGLSYVTEPVHVGEPVVLNLIAERTELGARCILTSGQSLFTEAGGIMTPGSAIHPSRQIGEQQTRMRIMLTPPDTLQPGRIELYLSLEYDCDGRRVFDRTDTVIYALLPAG